MDGGQQINEGEFTNQAFFHTFILIFVNFSMTWCSVMLTNMDQVKGSLVVLEGVYFALAYFLHTHDFHGTRLLVFHHILSIIPIFTKLKILSSVLMTVFATLYPRFMMLTAIVLVSRVLNRYDIAMQYFTTARDQAECFYILIGILLILYYYMLFFHYKSFVDWMVILPLLCTFSHLPNILGSTLTVMLSIVYLWVELKASSLQPRSTFPRRALPTLLY